DLHFERKGKSLAADVLRMPGWYAPAQDLFSEETRKLVMLKRFMAWLESRIDVFAPFDDRQVPPSGLAAFAAFYLRSVRGWLGLVFLSALLLAAVEASLLLLVGRFVDILAASQPDALFETHGPLLLAGAVVLLILRPFVHVFNEGIINQVVVPQLTNRIRWRTHLYTLGHSLSYFQGDFA